MTITSRLVNIAFLLSTATSLTFIAHSSAKADDDFKLKLESVKKIEPEEWDENSGKVSAKIKLDAKSDNPITCGVSLTSATTDTGETLEENFGFSSSDDFRPMKLKTSLFDVTHNVAVSYPKNKAKQITLKGNVCVFLPDQTKEQKITIPNAPSIDQKVILNAPSGISIAILNESIFDETMKKAIEIYENTGKDKDAANAQYIDSFGPDLGKILTSYFDSGYAIGGTGDINLILTGKLSNIAKIDLTTDDGKLITSSQKGFHSSGKKSGHYYERFFDSPPSSAQLEVHLTNENNIKQIPFNFEFAPPK